MKWLLLLLPIGLLACATSEPMTFPDGTTGHNISCDGMLQSMGECYKKAGDLCPGGYDIVGGNYEGNPIGGSTGYVSANTQALDGGYITQYGAVIYRDLYVRCH